MQMNISEAKAKLSELIAAVERGEEVVIARGGHPVVKLVSMGRPAAFRIGLADGQAGRIPDFLEPMSEEELEPWG
ncbi:MAG: type II toxin-antitoxin system Phd/YefM family antitoxin [Brevundimonas sp.]